MTEVVRIPLVVDSSARDGSNPVNNAASPDSNTINAVFEKSGTGPKMVKRPGYLPFSSIGATGGGQGLFYFNGLIYAVISDVLYVNATTFNSTDGTAWTSSPPAWAARGSFGYCVYKDRIWVAAGNIVGAAVADVWSTTDGVNWNQQTGAAPFGYRRDFSMAVLNDTMFLMGGVQPGVTPTYFADVWSSTDGTNWTQVTNSAPWGARGGFGLVPGNNGLYLFGGQNAAGANFNDVWFTPDGVNWSQITPAAPWSARMYMGCCWWNNKIWMYGGQTTGASFSNDVWNSLDGITWTRPTNAALSTVRAGAAMCVYNNSLWLAGGYQGATTYAQVYSSPDGTTWTQATGSPGWTATFLAGFVAFAAPYAASPFRFPTLFYFGGINQTGIQIAQQFSFYGNLDKLSASSYPLNPATVQQTYQFTTYMNGTRVLIKNQSNFWVFDAGALVKVVDPSYPSVTVPGLVVLDAFAHVLTPSGEVHSCKLDDATVWPDVQFLTADYEDDPALAQVKYLNFIMVLSQYTLQLFYDAANPEGSELQPYQSGNTKVGCAAGQTVVSLGTTVLWVGQTEEGLQQVYMMNGLTPQVVSNNTVDRWLANVPAFGTLYAFPWIGGGHQVYVLGGSTGFPLGQCWAYEPASGIWSAWVFPTNELGRINWTPTASTYSPNSNIFLSPSNGTVYQVDGLEYDDNGTPFPVGVQTTKNDAGLSARKFWGRATLICDQQQSPTTTVITTSDDDFQTFQARGTVDESADRPFVIWQGSSRKRAWNITRTDSNPLRWEALEVEFSKGES